jgi:hypothetical protein
MTRIITRVASASRSDKQGLPAHASQQLRHELREQLKDPSLPPSCAPSLPWNNERDQRTINQHSPTLQFGWMVVGRGVFH